MQTLTVTTLALLAATLTLAHAHFTLKYPISIGHDDEKESTAPCGALIPADSSEPPTAWPIAGSYVSVLTTHPEAMWQFQVARRDDLSNWRPLTPTLVQGGRGYFCKSSIPGIPEWVGQDAVLQVTQSGHEEGEDLYQCASIRFTTSAALAADPASCYNSSGMALSWMTELPDTVPNSQRPPEGNQLPQGGGEHPPAGEATKSDLTPETPMPPLSSSTAPAAATSEGSSGSASGKPSAPTETGGSQAGKDHPPPSQVASGNDGGGGILAWSPVLLGTALLVLFALVS